MGIYIDRGIYLEQEEVIRECVKSCIIRIDSSLYTTDKQLILVNWTVVARYLYFSSASGKIFFFNDQ